jgi:hypothetical protein
VRLVAVAISSVELQGRGRKVAGDLNAKESRREQQIRKSSERMVNPRDTSNRAASGSSAR